MTNPQSRIPLVILISGRGSNLKAIGERSLASDCPYSIQAIGSDREDAEGLKYGSLFDCPTFVVSRKDFKGKTEFFHTLMSSVQKNSPAFVVLAGFMRILTPQFLEAFPDRVINIHPSLLPALPGLHTHERALEENFTKHGVTVHGVDSGLDSGPIIAQASVPVESNDTPESLQKRVLLREHQLYPWVLEKLAIEDIVLTGRTVSIRNAAVREAEELNFELPSDIKKI